jgi:hypothetical protein
VAASPFRRSRDGGIHVELPAEAARLLIRLSAELEPMAADPSLAGPEVAARIQPDAIPDDPDANEMWMRLAADDLKAERVHRASVFGETLARGIEKRSRFRVSLTDEEADAWLTSINHMRLAIGTQCGVSADTDLNALSKSDPRYSRLVIYDLLTWVLDSLVDVLAQRS